MISLLLRPAARLGEMLAAALPQRGVPREDMVRIPGGEFLMGSEDFYPEEAPVHRVRVDGFGSIVIR